MRPLRYKTLSGMAEAEIVEKKSKFIAAARPVESEAEARAFIEERRRLHPDASHHAYAYQIGFNSEIRKMSDDGEPGGTAGMPIMDVIRNGNILNAAVVVTRYFGGTLLGAGGLVRAYGKAARESVANAGVAELSLHYEIRVILDYSAHKKIMYHATQRGYIVKNTEYTDVVTLFVVISDAEADTCIGEISEMTGGRAVIEKIGECYIDGD